MQQSQRSDALLLKVDTASKVTVEAIERLENRLTPAPTPPGKISTHDLSEISSQLSRIESWVSLGRSLDSQNDSETDAISHSSHSRSTSQNDLYLKFQVGRSRTQRPPSPVPQYIPSVTLHKDETRAFKAASFVGHPSLPPTWKHYCICCGHSPSVFDSADELK